MVDDTGVPGENLRPTLQLATFSTWPRRDANPRSGERQQAVSGNTLDQLAIRAGWQSTKQWISQSGPIYGYKEYLAIQGWAVLPRDSFKCPG